MSDKRSTFPCPMVKRPFAGFRSPVTDEYIANRKELERDLARHDCMPAQDIKKNPRIYPTKDSDHAG